MTRRLSLVLGTLLLGAVVACGGGDDGGPTGLDDLADVAGMSFELVGIGRIYGYRDIVPGTLGTGACPADPELVEATEFREGELSFGDDGTWVLEMRVRTHCYDPDAEVIVPDWSPVITRQTSGEYVTEDDRLFLYATSEETVYAYLEDGGLRLEFQPTTGSVESGNVLLFE